MQIYEIYELEVHFVYFGVHVDPFDLARV